MRSCVIAAVSLALFACKPSVNSSAKGLPPISDAAEDELTQAARALVNLSPKGVAIGEVHGQLEGVKMLEAVVNAALENFDSIVVLIEVVPVEAGLDTETIPLSDFRAIEMSNKSLHFWTKNIDKRATWELHSLVSALKDRPKVELSYFYDPRLNPAPNHLKAHGMAERWHIAQKARPNSYIVALAGNHHTKVQYNYPLEVTNSICRYLYETYGYKPVCISVDHQASGEDGCVAGLPATLSEGAALFEPWNYVVRRTDRCTRSATWVGEKKSQN